EFRAQFFQRVGERLFLGRPGAAADEDRAGKTERLHERAEVRFARRRVLRGIIKFHAARVSDALARDADALEARDILRLGHADDVEEAPHDPRDTVETLPAPLAARGKSRGGEDDADAGGARGGKKIRPDAALGEDEDARLNRG